MMKNNHCVIALSAAIISLSCVNCQDARHGRQYKIIKDIAELQNTESLDDADLSSLDLRDCEDLFLGKTGFDENGVKQWTDRVIWPETSKMPEGFDPQELLEASKMPKNVAGLHAKGITGKGVKIAIIDQRLFKEHPEYKDRIKYYEVFGDNWQQDGIDYHGSLVTGVAAGKSTGTAPEADIYYFAANNWPDDKSQPNTMRTINQAIRKIIDMNKTFPEREKIRFISMSSGTPDDAFAKEREELFDEAEQNGIMVLGGFYKHTMRNNSFDIRYGFVGRGLGIPTDGKTNPYFDGGYAYERLGGASSTFPYLAGVFAMALQDNQNFTRLPHWQDRLMKIAYDTAVDSVVNPEGIVEEVSRIAQTLQ